MTAPDDGSQRVTDGPRRGGRDGTASRPAKTSAAAVFPPVFGLAALFCALTPIIDNARAKLPSTQQVRNRLAAR